jgi:hypothetical protein
MQRPTGDELARLSKHLKTRYHLDSLYPAFSQSQIPDLEVHSPNTVTFIGTAEVITDKKMSIVLTLSYEAAIALIQRINFLDNTAM